MGLLSRFGIGGARPYERVTASDVERRLGEPNPPRVLDVRDAQTYAQGHIPGSVNIPLATLQGQAKRLDAKRPIVVVCYHGNTSRQAALMLAQLGFEQVASMNGGMAAWHGARVS